MGEQRKLHYEEFHNICRPFLGRYFCGKQEECGGNYVMNNGDMKCTQIFSLKSGSEVAGQLEDIDVDESSDK
jgi:hypothetical protein